MIDKFISPGELIKIKSDLDQQQRIDAPELDKKINDSINSFLDAMEEQMQHSDSFHEKSVKEILLNTIMMIEQATITWTIALRSNIQFNCSK